VPTVADAIAMIARQNNRLNIKPAIEVLRKYADTLPSDERGAVYDDTEIMLREWDQYLRSGSSQTRALPGFLSSMALGSSQQIKSDGTALLTVHSSKGLEFASSSSLVWRKVCFRTTGRRTSPLRWPRKSAMRSLLSRDPGGFYTSLTLRRVKCRGAISGTDNRRPF
jgi:hypothetical protein